MHINLNVSKKFFGSLFLISLILLIGYYLAHQFVIPRNEYAGMVITNKKNSVLFLSFLLVFSGLLLIGKNIKTETPIKILFFVFTYFIFLWYGLFSEVSGYKDLFNWLLVVFLMIFPFVSIMFFKGLLIKYFVGTFIKFRIKPLIDLPAVFIVFLLVIFVKIYFVMGGVSFSFSDAYVRRIQARELVSGWPAYAFAAGLNTIAPLLSFYGSYQKKYLLLLLGLVFCLLGFGFIGTKAPIAYSLILMFAGYQYAQGKPFLFYLILASFIIFLIALIEFICFDYSWVADVLIRRGFIVPSQLIGHYSDFFIEHYDGEDWLWGRGALVTFTVGELYQGNELTNANTNAFIYEIGRSGIIGYGVMILFLSVYYCFLEAVYVVTKNPMWLVIGFLYAMLLIEQSYSTAFITSGIAIATFFVFFLGANK